MNELKSSLLCSPCLAPEWAYIGIGELLQSVDEGECVSKGTTKDDLRRGDVAVGVGGVA